MLAMRVKKLDKRSANRGYKAVPWMEIIQMVLGFLGTSRKPVDPAPPNPTPNPTPAQAKAWQDAWHLKWNAEQSGDSEHGYSGPAFTRTAKGIKKQQKRDGSKISLKEAQDSAADLFDEANASKLEDIYSDVLEANHVSGN